MMNCLQGTGTVWPRFGGRKFYEGAVVVVVVVAVVVLNIATTAGVVGVIQLKIGTTAFYVVSFSCSR